MSTVTISHEAQEGTLIRGDFRPHQALVKAEGFRWSGRERFWYLPSSRDKIPNVPRIERVAAALRSVGFTVEVDIDSTVRSTAEVEADRSERLADRAEGLEAKAARLAAEAEAKFARADQLGGVMAGQPILIGHHSEKRHRKDLERMNSGAWNGMDAYRDSKEAAHAAKASVASTASRETVPVTLRRIERLGVELRDIERKMAGKPCVTSDHHLKETAPDHSEFKCPFCGEMAPVVDRTISVHYSKWDGPASGDYGARISERAAQIRDEIAYWSAHVATMEASGVKIWSKADFVKGDFVKYSGGWSEVVRVNAKSVSVKTPYSWTNTVSYDKVTGRRAAEVAS